MVTYYKVVDKNNKSFNGGDFDYTPYIDGKNATPLIEDISLCNKGYHITKYWNMWIRNKDDIIYEVEPFNILEDENIGVDDKVVCKSLRIIKRFIPKYKNKLNTGNLNTGNWNTGNMNTGDMNTGNWNTGDYNTGNYNTGDKNTGKWNTGNRNTGDKNTGDRNTGDKNTGKWNTGNMNTGDYNTGSINTGCYNTGNNNTGYYNTGNWNTGNWNTSDWNTGALNTKKPKYTQLFNKNILFSEYEKIEFPKYFYFDLEKNYKESWIKSFNKATKKEIEDTIKLPNFSYKVFEEITGITKDMIKNKLKVK